MSYEKTRELFIEYEASEGEAKYLKRNEIFNHNWRLVAYVIKNYTGRGVDQKDLISEGNLGLLAAIEKYDYRT